MLFLKKDNLETLIIKALKDKGLSGPDIIESVAQKKPGITRQAIYVVLRRFIQEDVLYKTDHVYSLNRLWLKEMYSFAGNQLNELQKADTAHIVDLEDGDRITYQFKNPHLMDIYWEHIFDTLLETHDKKLPIVIYHPHDWLIYARKESEEFFVREFEKKKILGLFAVGGKTTIDLLFKKRWQNDFLQISCGKSYGFEDGYYMNIMGDLIFEIFIEQKFNDDINQVFSLDENDPVFKRRMHELSLRKYKTKLIISKNKKKVHRIFQKITKDFVLPKGFYFSSSE